MYVLIDPIDKLVESFARPDTTESEYDAPPLHSKGASKGVSSLLSGGGPSRFETSNKALMDMR